jgi:hypothetical protein
MRRLNGLDNLDVIEAAVSKQDGTVNFRVGPSHVNNSITSSVVGENTIPVQSVRLDTFVASHRAPSLLLIDVGGAEIEVLESGLETISRCRPVIKVEVHWLGPSFIDYFRTDLKTYRLSWFDVRWQTALLGAGEIPCTPRSGLINTLLEFLGLPKLSALLFPVDHQHIRRCGR